MEKKQMSLKRGSDVLVFSEKTNKWLEGSIVDILHDKEGEWLVVTYDNGKRTKQVQRFSDYVVARKRSRQATKSADRAPDKSKAAPKRSDTKDKDMVALKQQLNKMVIALTRQHCARIDDMQNRIPKLGLPRGTCCSRKATNR